MRKSKALITAACFLSVSLGAIYYHYSTDKSSAASLYTNQNYTCQVESHFSPFEDVTSIVVSELAKAKKTVHGSLYGISNTRITFQLASLLSQKVDVQLGLDKMQSAGRFSTYDQLQNDGAAIFIKKSNVLEHNKFVIIDDSTVITGSWNFSNNADRQDNNIIILRCPEAVKSYKADFLKIKARDDN